MGYRFFNKGESILRGLPFSFFMVYVISKDWLQVGLLASYVVSLVMLEIITFLKVMIHAQHHELRS